MSIFLSSLSSKRRTGLCDDFTFPRSKLSAARRPSQFALHPVTANHTCLSWQTWQRKVIKVCRRLSLAAFQESRCISRQLQPKFVHFYNVNSKHYVDPQRKKKKRNNKKQKKLQTQITNGERRKDDLLPQRKLVRRPPQYYFPFNLFLSFCDDWLHRRADHWSPAHLSPTST